MSGGYGGGYDIFLEDCEMQMCEGERKCRWGVSIFTQMFGDTWGRVWKAGMSKDMVPV